MASLIDQEHLATGIGLKKHDSFTHDAPPSVHSDDDSDHYVGGVRLDDDDNMESDIDSDSDVEILLSAKKKQPFKGRGKARADYSGGASLLDNSSPVLAYVSLPGTTGNSQVDIGKSTIATKRHNTNGRVIDDQSTGQASFQIHDRSPNDTPVAVHSASQAEPSRGTVTLRDEQLSHQTSQNEINSDNQYRISASVSPQIRGSHAVQGQLAQQTLGGEHQKTWKPFNFNAAILSGATPDRQPQGSQELKFTPQSNTGCSPGQSKFMQSEPHSFAPRASNSITSGPPPRFLVPSTISTSSNGNNAETTVSGPSATSHDQQDPFTIGPWTGGQQNSFSGQSPQLAVAASVGQVVPNYVQGQRSALLNQLTQGPTGRPTLDVALSPDYFPFIENARQAQPVTHGVIKIKNIPFNTKRAEIIALLGRNSRILNDTEEPVHIIMERVNSKTHDAYVEFVTMHDAVKAVEKHNQSCSRNRPGRLGDRPVDIELSSQGALMTDLFPSAKGIFWNGSVPQLKPFAPREPWNNFKGFITEEEMTMLIKHVEIPQRSPFSRECPQRPFECMISTIKKLPWYMTGCITMRQRYCVYKATVELIRLLQLGIRDRRHDTLTAQLLKRLSTAAMLCPGFTVTMKDDIAYVVGLSDMEQADFNQPRFADSWRHAYALAPKPGLPVDVLEWFIAVIREESTRHLRGKPYADRNQVEAQHKATDGYFGYFWHEVGFPSGPAFDYFTLAEAASLEFAAIEKIFERAFARG